LVVASAGGAELLAVGRGRDAAAAIEDGAAAVDAVAEIRVGQAARAPERGPRDERRRERP
jgi:hypothetical protein